ncbi:DUF2397 family protein [Streptomyces sp. NPDC059979]|uniref:DUF2397 family protein n=1 Tax=Streptomyces sp. NPDC059979 TaxID=3347021 RepID=UPI00368D8DD3
MSDGSWAQCRRKPTGQLLQSLVAVAHRAGEWRAMTHSTTGPKAQPGAYGPFAHLTAPNAVLYRHAMRAFVTAKERFAVHLRPEDVYAALPAEARSDGVDGVAKALDSLVGWGNLRADPDTARVTASRTASGSGWMGGEAGVEPGHDPSSTGEQDTLAGLAWRLSGELEEQMEKQGAQTASGCGGERSAGALRWIAVAGIRDARLTLGPVSNLFSALLAPSDLLLYRRASFSSLTDDPPGGVRGSPGAGPRGFLTCGVPPRASGGCARCPGSGAVVPAVQQVRAVRGVPYGQGTAGGLPPCPSLVSLSA